MGDITPPLKVLTGLFDLVLSVYPPDLTAAIRDELPWLRSRAFRLAVELQDAEERHVTYAEAACLPTEFPLVARIHHGVIAMLNEELPLEALHAMRDAIARAKKLSIDGARDALAELTRAETYEGALLRFFIYQSARIERWVRTWDKPAFEASGALSRLDDEAQDRLTYWLCMPTPFPNVRPLAVASAELLLRLEQVAAELRGDLESAALETLERFQYLMDAATRSREMPLADAVVVRNEYAQVLGERRLASSELAEYYPRHFPSINAVDKRRERVRRGLARSGPRAIPRVVDLARLAIAASDEAS